MDVFHKGFNISIGNQSNNFPNSPIPKPKPTQPTLPGLTRIKVRAGGDQINPTTGKPIRRIKAMGRETILGYEQPKGGFQHRIIAPGQEMSAPFVSGLKEVGGLNIDSPVNSLRRRAIVPYDPPVTRSATGSGRFKFPKLDMSGLRGMSGARMMRYGGTALAGIGALNRFGRAYESAQNGRMGGALANAAFGAGLAYAAYDLGIARGALSQHLYKAASQGIGKMEAGTVKTAVSRFFSKGIRF